MSPRTSEENERIKAQTRQRILEAGLKVFALRGYHAATIGEVAGEAGLSHGLVYHYFTSKEDILLELTAMAFEGSITANREAASVPGTAWEKLESIASMLHKNAIRGMSSYYFHLMLQAKLLALTLPKLGKLMKKRGHEYNDILVPLLKQGQREGSVVKGNPEQLANSFWALIQGLALAGLQAKGGGEITSPEIMLHILRKRSSP
jgi:AcrR family transcriptional regulator